MKGPENNTIVMSGEQMEILVGAGCLTGLRSPEAVQLPLLLQSLCKNLSSRSISRYFIRHVRIGNSVVLVDKKIGYTFSLKMEARSIRILSISKQLPPPESKRIAQVLYIAGAQILRAVGRTAVAA